MKKIYLLSILLCGSSLGFSQWMPLSSGVLSSLRSVYFINENVGWACGEISGNYAPILKTIDGGNTWSVINHPTLYALRGIQFVDADTGVIVGFHGTILRTVDGGDTWDSIPFGTLDSLRSVNFPSHDTGYACGSGGTILKTTDAGLTWTFLTSGLGGILINIRFLNNDVGYAVQSGPATQNFLEGYVIKTTDGGDTWETVFHDSINGLLAVSIPDDSTVYVAGANQSIFKSSNAGSTWDPVYSGVSDTTFRDASFIDSNTGWIVGGTNGDILYTNDGGNSWAYQNIIPGFEFLGIYFPSDTIGFAVGTGGIILKYHQPCQPLSPLDTIDGLSFEICPDDTILYGVDSITGGTNYAFSIPAGATIVGGNGSNVILVAFTDQSGYISATVTNECDTVFRQDFITVHPAAIPSITFDGVLLTSSAASTYQWRIDGSLIAGATNQTYTPVANGDYNVDVTNEWGCAASSLPYNLTAVAMSELNANALLEIFPNPMASSATIIVGGNFSGQYVLITDMQGRVLRDLVADQNQKIKIDRKDFVTGMYFISLVTESKELIGRQKFVVQ